MSAACSRTIARYAAGLPSTAGSERAASAAWSRKAFYVETDGVLEEEDFRQGESGPYAAEPCKDGQGRLLRAVLAGLKAARTIRPEEAE